MVDKDNLCDVTGKICYSQKDAGSIINGARHNRKNKPKRMYLCKHCNSYHLTHFKTMCDKYKRIRKMRGF